jgi:hypothetical protein
MIKVESPCAANATEEKVVGVVNKRRLDGSYWIDASIIFSLLLF